MKKSPLNNLAASLSTLGSSGGGGNSQTSSGNNNIWEMGGNAFAGPIADAAQAIQGGIKTQSLRDTPNALMGDGSEAITEHETIYKHIKKDVNPSFETAVQGDIMQSTGSVTQSAHEKPLGDVFEPGARVAAENMFGATVPGNFGRSMGG